MKEVLDTILADLREWGDENAPMPYDLVMAMENCSLGPRSIYVFLVGSIRKNYTGGIILADICYTDENSLSIFLEKTGLFNFIYIDEDKLLKFRDFCSEDMRSALIESLNGSTVFDILAYEYFSFEKLNKKTDLSTV